MLVFRRSFQHACTTAIHSTGSATTCTDAYKYKAFKTPQHASSSIRGASTSRPSCSSYIGFQSANVRNSRWPCWCTSRSPACVPGGRLSSCVYHWTPRRLRSSDIDTCLAQRTNTRLGDRSFADVGPQVWNSLPTQLRESDITLGLFRRALKTHLFGYWKLQCRVTVFYAMFMFYPKMTWSARRWTSSSCFVCSLIRFNTETHIREQMRHSWFMVTNNGLKNTPWCV